MKAILVAISVVLFVLVVIGFRSYSNVAQDREIMRNDVCVLIDTWESGVELVEYDYPSIDTAPVREAIKAWRWEYECLSRGYTARVV